MNTEKTPVGVLVVPPVTPKLYRFALVALSALYRLAVLAAAVFLVVRLVEMNAGGWLFLALPFATLCLLAAPKVAGE